ncbi:MAG: HesA/MoeB/ThiF family protein [Fibromonadaceae bacterium]|jgi:adenylyltransferase/sulfurtransferase|nr:HesA/MoeB/ThiF family protein [Fibromonadaceae bacterium]
MNSLTRYERHLILPGVGDEGQQKINSARVLIVGMGGLGSPVALYLAAAGVGTMGLSDFDLVEESNLQRQVIHSMQSIGKPKVESARERINALNPHINVAVHNVKLDSENAVGIIKSYDIIADCSDNFETRYILNEACVLLEKPCIHGSIFEFRGQVSVFCTEEGPCYRCLYPEPPPGRVFGTLGTLPGIIGSIMANETLKLILKAPNLAGRLLLFNAWETNFKELRVEKDENCPICGKNIVT